MSLARAEHFCTRCGAFRPKEAFCASALRRHRHVCAACTNGERTRTRKVQRARALAIALRQREKRRSAASELTAAQIDLLLRASRNASVWRAADDDAAEHLSIDRIALDRPLRLENAVVLTATQIRSRARSAVDPMPPHVRELASAIAHAVAQCSDAAP
jgi:hypothetical protein